MYLHILRFQFSVSQSSEIEFCVIWLATRANRQPHVVFCMSKYCLCFFVFSMTHIVPNSLPSHRPVLCVVSSLFSSLVDEVCLPFCVVCG
jgi:hypothetical protein